MSTRTGMITTTAIITTTTTAIIMITATAKGTTAKGTGTSPAAPAL